MTALKPPALKPGDTIGVFAPSSFAKEDLAQKSKMFFENKGFEVFIHPQSYLKNNQSAGTHEDKIKALYDLFTDENIDGVIVTGGGNRALHLLHQIDFDVIKNNPKILMGYSDTSALLLGLYAKTGLIGFHGPSMQRTGRYLDVDPTTWMISGEIPDYNFSQATILKSGSAKGPLIGGCLSVFQAFIGTDFMPDLEGAILFLEDVSDHTSRFDRTFAHLRLAGAFDKISGLIIGEFHDLQDNPDKPFGFSMEEIVMEHVGWRDIPIIFNAPFGHGDNLCVFPVGGQAELSADQKISFHLTEHPVNI